MMRPRISIVTTLFAILTCSVCPNLTAQKSSCNEEVLKGNEVKVTEITNSGGLPGVQAKFLIEGDRKEIWGMLNDYENYVSIYGGVDKLKVLSSDTNGATVEMWLDVGVWKYVGIKVHFVLRRNYDSKYSKLTWHRVSGDLRVIDGGWEICDSPDPNQNMLIYTTFIRYGGIIPTRLIRNGAMSAAKDMGERLCSWLKNHPGYYK